MALFTHHILVNQSTEVLKQVKLTAPNILTQWNSIPFHSPNPEHCCYLCSCCCCDGHCWWWDCCCGWWHCCCCCCCCCCCWLWKAWVNRGSGVVAVLAPTVLSPEGDDRRDAMTSLLGAAVLAPEGDTSDGRSSPSTEDAAVAIKCSNCDDRLCSSLLSNCVCSVPPTSKQTHHQLQHQF